MDEHSHKKRKLSSDLTPNNDAPDSETVECPPSTMSAEAACANDSDHPKINTENRSPDSVEKSECCKDSRLQPIKDVTRPDPVEGRCQFYLQRKHRHCRTVPHGGSQFCVEHTREVSSDTGLKKRIRCPLDSKHSCYEDQLEKHLKKCNVTKFRSDIPEFYVENINKGGNPEDNKHDHKVSIRDISDSDVLELVKTVQRLHQEHVGNLETEILFHDILKEEAEKDKNGAAAQKHIQQQASIVGHLRHSGLLHDRCSYLEFGAGKGGLSHWVQLTLRDATNNQYLLIDKGSVRYKMDNFHKGQNQGPTFERLKIDIQHLQLGKVPSLMEDHRPIVGLGKHLCGGATDMMLRCLMESSFEEMKKKNESSPVSGLALALCCHHRCDWQTYVGKDFFQWCGLTARDFHLITSMTSWATCGTKPAGDVTADHPSQDGRSDFAEEPVKKGSYNHQRYGNLLPEEREEIGRQCKQLIDTGRRKYLMSHGFDAKHVYYVDKKHTLENMILIATRKICTA